MDTDYKELEKEELIIEILQKDNLISELENKINTVFERLQNANENNESLRNVIADLQSRNEELVKACKIHVSNNVKLIKELDKVNKDIKYK